MRLLLLLYRQVKGSLYLEKYTWERERYTRSSYIILIMNWLICVKYFSNIRERGKFTTGAQFVSTKQVNSSRKQSPSKFRLYRYTGGLWELLLLLHRCTKGKSEREKTENHIFHVASWREINPLFSCVLFVSSAYYLVGHAAVVGDGNGGF
jgi:hypothetical protein